VKRRLIFIVTAAAVVALTVWVLVLTSANKEVIDSGDENSLYSYTYEQSEKSILIKISGDFARNSWSAASDYESIAKVHEKSNGKGKASFLVKPEGNGSAKVTMTLVDEESENEGYKIIVSVFVDSDGVIEVLDSRSVMNSNQTFSGSIESCSYSVMVTGSEMSVGFMGDNTMQWYTESNLYDALNIGDADRQIETESDDGSSMAADFFAITVNTSGTGYIRFVNPQMTTALEVSVSASVDDIITVLSVNTVSYTPKELAEYETAMNLITLMGGEKMIPGKLSPANYFSYAGETSNGKSYDKAGMSLSIDGKSWSYEMYSGLTLYEVKTLNTAQTTESYVQAGTKSVTIQIGEGYSGAIWQEENCVCRISSMEDDLPTKAVTTKAVQTVVGELESAE